MVKNLFVSVEQVYEAEQKEDFFEDGVKVREDLKAHKGKR